MADAVQEVDVGGEGVREYKMGRGRSCLESIKKSTTVISDGKASKSDTDDVSISKLSKNKDKGNNKCGSKNNRGDGSGAIDLSEFSQFGDIVCDVLDRSGIEWASRE